MASRRRNSTPNNFNMTTETETSSENIMEENTELTLEVEEQTQQEEIKPVVIAEPPKETIAEKPKNRKEPRPARKLYPKKDESPAKRRNVPRFS